ncbi:MAG: response regulator [Phycisphaerae bacterium]
MSKPTDRRIRKDAESIKDTLDALDQTSLEAKKIGPRRAERFKYRVSAMQVDFPTDSGGWQSHAVATRNISRGGVGFVVGQFVYPGSRCRIHLRTIYNSTHVVSGKVQRCRYLVGSGNLHEVGVKLDAPIDIVMFTRGAMDTRVLLADDDTELHKLVARMLQSCGVELMCVPDGEQAIEKVKSDRFAIVVLDLDMPGKNGYETLKSLRDNGYMGPIVAITSSDDDETQKRCLQDGFDAVLPKPFNRASLECLIASLQDAPIISSLVHDADMAEFIDAFVETLHQEVRTLESCLVQKDFEQLKRMARELKGRAGTHGFDIITSAAAEIERALTDSPDPADIRTKLTKLVRLCLAARPATARAIEH